MPDIPELFPTNEKDHTNKRLAALKRNLIEKDNVTDEPAILEKDNVTDEPAILEKDNL